MLSIDIFSISYDIFVNRDFIKPKIDAKIVVDISSSDQLSKDNTSIRTYKNIVLNVQRSAASTQETNRSLRAFY